MDMLYFNLSKNCSNHGSNNDNLSTTFIQSEILQQLLDELDHYEIWYI